MKEFYLFICLSLLVKLSYSQISYTWNGATSTNWNTTTNWTPNGLPGSIDNVTIVTGANNCILANNTTITNLTITSGLLNLNAFTLNTTGVVACNSGSCTNGTFNSTATTLTFAGTTFGANIIATVADVYFNGSTFNGSVNVTKTSASNIQSTGNNVFNGITSITNAGSGYLLLTNGGVGRDETFNANATFATTNIGGLYIGYGRNVNINANITVNNPTSSGLIQIGRIGSVNLASGKTITCGTFAGATLNLYGIMQVGATAQNFLPSSNGGINIYTSNFTAPLTVNAGIISAQTSTFAAAVTYSASGTILNTWSSGGNIYNGTLNVTNSSNGYFGFANGTGDIYNGVVNLNNNSTTGGRIIFGNNCTSQFNNNINVTQNGTTPASGIAFGWGGTFPVINLAAGKNIFVTGGFTSGYLQILKMQAATTTAINLTTTGTSNVQLNNNIFNGTVNVNAPDIYAYGGTYNAPTTFIKTAGTGNHNSGNLNIFNSTLDIQNQSSTGYFMLGYQSADQFNDNITVSSIASGGISFGWNGGSGTPTLASGKTLSIGAAGFSDGFLRLGGFTQLGTSTPINLTLTGTAYIEINANPIPCVFNSSFSTTAPDIYVRGGTFNGTAEFTKTGGSSNHNNGNQNVFNSTCTINQQSTTGYFMLGYNSNDLFNGDIVVTNTGTQGIYFGWYAGSTGTPTQVAGKTITVGAAGFNGGLLYFGSFTQLGSSPVNLNFTGTTASLQFAYNSIFNGNIISNTPSLYFSNSTFNGTINSNKTGPSNDASAGGNIFNGTFNLTNSGSGLVYLGNGLPDTWNNDVIFNNNGSSQILPCYNSVGNLFNGNITVNSSPTAVGISFCNAAAATATISAGKTINTGIYDGGNLVLQRFTQLGSVPVNLILNTTANNLYFGPSSYLGGNVTSVSPSLYLNGCIFNGTSDLTKNGSAGNYGQGGNIFNGLSTITNSGSSYLLLGNSNPDVWNNDVVFTNTGSERLLPAWATVGNLFNGNIYVNTGGSAQGIQFCGGNATATATLAATKTIASGTLGLNAGYLILKQFTQLGSAAITLTLNPTATYLQYGPLSNLGGNVTSVSPRLFFHGCTFNGITNCTKNGISSDQSNGNNIFNSVTTITHSGIGPGYLMLGNGNSDQFNTTTTFNNIGGDHIYVAYNSIGNIFGGVTTFNNSPTANTLIYVSQYSAGSIFNDNIVVTSTNGQGVQFCNGNVTATATLVTGKTISVGGAGFNSGTLLLKQFTQVGPTPQVLNLTGTGNLTFGPTSYFGGDMNCSSPTLFFNSTNFDRILSAIKTGTTSDGSVGGNIFNGVTTMTNSGTAGYLLLGATNSDLFNSSTTFNNIGGGRFYFAHNHGGQTTIFNSDLTLNSNKTVGTDGWSYLVSEGTNSNYIINGNFIINNTGALQSYCRFLQGASTTATYNGNVTINLTNTFNNTQIQMGNSGTSFYNGNISVNNTSPINTGGGIYFNAGASASSTLAATKTITLGAGGFVAGELSLLRFTQVSATPQALLQTTGTGRLILGPTSIFDGNVNFNFPQVLLNGTTYNGLATIEKNGATDNSGSGGNVFNGTTVITNSGSGYLMTGNTTADAFNAPTTFNNTGTYRIFFAQNHTGQTTTFASSLTLNSNKSGGTDGWSYFICDGVNTNVSFGGPVTYNVLGNIQSNCRILQGMGTTAIYNNDLTINLSNSHISTQMQQGVVGVSTYNGNINVNSTAGANGIYFNVNATANSNMVATKSINTGIGGFNAGVLSIARFTQLGSATNLLLGTGTSRFDFGPTSLFGGDINSTSAALFFNTSTFNKDVTSIKNGTTNDASVGGNTFNGITSITNNGTGHLYMANTTSDTYNGNVIFTQNNTGIFYPNHNTNCTYGGNITVNSTGTFTITFGQAAGGIATLNNSLAQSINKTGTTGNPNFTRLIVNKSANDVTLNTRINVSTYLTLTQGIVNTTAVNILNMNNAATTTIGNALSFINGPMNYDMALNGTRTLNLPIGKVIDWRPAILTVTHNSGTSYTYNSELFNSGAQFLGWAMPPTVSNVSRVHWWDIERKNTSTGVITPTLNLVGNQTITLYYDVNDDVTDPTNLVICKNTYTALTAWKDIGGSGATITTGNVTSTSAPTAFNSFSRFTLGNTTAGTNPLPVELLYFTANPVNNQVNTEWATATEINNDYYEVERSIDGVNFEFAKTIKAYGTGNSTAKQTYTALDDKPYKGLSYYRLKQIDKTGEFKYSKIADVTIQTNSFINVYPNPVNTTLFVNYSDDYNNASVKIINALGAIVKESNAIKLFNGQMNVADLSNGIYYVLIQNGIKTENIKISIQK